MKTTEQNIQEFLEKLSDMIIEFEDANDFIVGSSIYLLSQSIFADFSFNGKKFIGKVSYTELFEDITTEIAK